MRRNAWYPTILLFVFVFAVFGLTSCGDNEPQQDVVSDGDAENLDRLARGVIDEVFGNGFKDLSPVVARVGDIEITEKDMELRLREMPNSLRTRFSGDTGPKTLVRHMADEALLLQQAKKDKVYLNTNVAQQLISFHRQTLIDAYKQIEVFAGEEPSEEEIRNHYDEYSSSYVIAGAVKARHIECATEQEALAAYSELQGSGEDAVFAHVLSKYTKNAETEKNSGSLGWFNEGGFIANVGGGTVLSGIIFDWDMGLHPPVEVGGNWHVVEILGRRPARQQALAEVRDRVVQELTPSLQAGILDAHLETLRETADIEFFGSLAPGEGRTAVELIKAGISTAEFDKKLDILDLVIEDFKGTDHAAQALFLKANAYIDRYGDTRHAGSCLRKLVSEYPDSPLIEQAEYMLANLGSKNFRTPASIEELRRQQK